MPKIQTNTTNFSAGEFAPELEGRSDIEKFNSSAKLLQNVVVLKQGGITHRPPLEFLGEVENSTASGRIIPFIYSTVDAYVLEFGELVMRVWKFGELVESSPGVPFELVTPYTAAELATLDFTQGADSMILTNGTRYPQRLRRFADNQWDIGHAPLNPPAVFEIGERPAADLTIDNAAVGAGRTITASAPAFLDADVGRTVAWGVGLALITAYTSTTVVTATVQTAFPTTVVSDPDWVLGASPMATVTPSAESPAGAAVTVTLDKPGWRPEDANGYIEVNGGLIKITGYTSSTVLDGQIIYELTSPTAALPDTWSLLLPLWNTYDGFPKTCTFYQQRLWFGNTDKFPESIWGSRSGLYFDFTPGTLDDSAVYKTAASDEMNPIQFLCSSKSLLMLGYGAEFEGKGGVEKPITPTNIQINVESEWGAAFVRPQTIGKEILFAERGGTSVRALSPGQIDGYETADISVYSEHLLRAGVKSMAYEKRPYAVLWVATNDEKLLALTYNREQNTIAWCSGFTDGAVEWLVSIPEGAADVTYALVRRTVMGVTRRYIERLSWAINRGKFDSVIHQSGAASATWPVPHLAGKTVAAVADGVYMGLFAVTAGQITLPRTATDTYIGLPIEAKAVVRAPEVGTSTGTSQGQAQSNNRIFVRLLRSVGLLVNGKTVEFRKLGANALDQQVPEFTGLKEVIDVGWSTGEADITLEQNQGMPWTVLSVIRSFTVNQG